MAKIKKGDTVKVITGKDRGKTGKVLSVHPEEDKVTVEGVMVHKRHLRAGASQKIPNGGIIDRPSKIHISNVKLYSEKLGKAVRVGVAVRHEKVTKADGSEGEKRVSTRVARGKHGGGAELG